MDTYPTVPLDRLRDSREIATVLRAGRRRAGRLVVLHSRERAHDDAPRNVTDGNVPGSTGNDAGNGAPSGAQPSPVMAEPRIAVVASRKVGGAVTRNRAKRLLREASRRIDWQPGTDLVLVARNGCAASRMDDVLDELRELADQLHVTRDAA